MRHILQDVKKYSDLIRQEGFGHASRFGLMAIRSRLMRRSEQEWERQWGLEFAGHIELDRLEIGSPNKVHGFSYGASSSLSIRSLLWNLTEDLSDFTFIDFGSGEGRALLAASIFPFSEIIGIEFAKVLHEAAVRNIHQVLGERQCRRVRSLHQDATDFEIPRRKCVFYFLNPFREAIFTRVLTNIEAAHRECGEPMYALYQQLGHGLESEQSTNISLLRNSPCFEEREIRIPALWDRFLLGSQQLNLFATKQTRG